MVLEQKYIKNICKCEDLLWILTWIEILTAVLRRSSRKTIHEKRNSDGNGADRTNPRNPRMTILQLEFQSFHIASQKRDGSTEAYRLEPELSVANRHSIRRRRRLVID